MNAAPSAIEQALRRAGVSDVDSTNLARALYSTDASLYRVVPQVVVRPRSASELVAAFEACRIGGVPFTVRGAGTSIAGNAIGTGVIADVSRHYNTVLEVDAEAQTATVQPGAVQASVQREAAKFGLRFGPDPSTSNRCTIGGMIGNNACGSRALAYGRTSDNVLALDVVAGTGERLQLGRDRTDPTSVDDSPLLTALQALVTENAELIRDNFGTFGRQVSGYALEHLLPENGFDVARFLVGSEGTLATTLQATVRLVRDPAFRVLVVLGYPSMADAADAVMAVLPHEPTACEGLDARIVDAIRTQIGAHRVPVLPSGSGWLFVEISGDDEQAVQKRAEAVVADSGTTSFDIVSESGLIAHLWRIREDGAGLSSRSPDGQPAYAGWEDAAVPPRHLGAYLREFEALMADHHITGMPYGHFGDGCVHVRLNFPLRQENGPQRMRAVIMGAAELVARYGGSLSGEHGDGRARSELLGTMYNAEVLALFAEVKALFDPAGVLNPGVLVDARPMDVDLRAPQAPDLRGGLGFSYRHDDGDFSKAVHRCTGVGKCRADTTASGGVMCPSYQATREEAHSTRGRARILQEMLNGGLLTDGWKSPEIHDALDLCLSCKGCASDCPTGVDMAAYKSEALYQRFKKRLRPRSHYALGWLPLWARYASKMPSIANALMANPVVARFGKWAAGVDQRRNLPQFAPTTLRQWFAQRPVPALTADTPVVALFVDTFTNYFSPEQGMDAIAVLEDAGYRVELTKDGLCCGLTWISTGQLDHARRLLQKTGDELDAYADRAIPVVGLEPSCTGVLRADINELVRGRDTQTASRNVRTLAEVLQATDGWTAPDLSGEHVVVQPHCHHHAVMGFEADAALLRSSGASVEQVGGCCGLAGNFGVEQGHYDVSVAVAEQNLLPAVRKAGDDAVVLADGFSCRTQLDDLERRPSQHLARLLAKYIGSKPR